MAFYRTLKPCLWLMKLPLFGGLLQKVWIKEGEEANWFIPSVNTIEIGADIPTCNQVVLPGLVVEDLLSEADGIFAMGACPCRTAFECQAHSWELGCLHLGPAAKRISEELGQRLTLEEGAAVLERALAEGLMPTILHMPSEAEIFGVDKTQMLSICFCCECCCDVRLLLREGPDRYWDLYNQCMPGLEVVVSEDCIGCGECVEACYGGERVITIEDSGAVINKRCIGCGRCAAVCPEEAISLVFDPEVDFMRAFRERISERVKI